MQFASLLVPMFPPGRCLMLFRLKERPPGAASGAATGGRLAAGGARAESIERSTALAQRQHWDAVWVDGARIMAEGILLSPRQASDHYTARLTGVLSQLTGRPTTQRQQQTGA